MCMYMCDRSLCFACARRDETVSFIFVEEGRPLKRDVMRD